MLEESYYTTGGKTHASPHLFPLYGVRGGGEADILSAAHAADGGGAATYGDAAAPEMGGSGDLSEKFTPAPHTPHDGVGGGSQHVLPVPKFTLYELLQESLEVAETMEVNGKRTFGYDAHRVPRAAD